MTLAELQTEIGTYCKIDYNSSLSNQLLITQSITRAFYKLMDEGKINAITKMRVPVVLTGSNTGVPIDLPFEVFDITEVRFKSGTIEWLLSNYEDVIAPAGVYGKPKAYRFVGKDQTLAPVALTYGLAFDSFIGIDTINDFAFLDYEALPDISTFIPANEARANEIRDAAILSILTYQGKIDQATLFANALKIPVDTSPSEQK